MDKVKNNDTFKIEFVRIVKNTAVNLTGVSNECVKLASDLIDLDIEITPANMGAFEASLDLLEVNLRMLRGKISNLSREMETGIVVVKDFTHPDDYRRRS